MPRILKDLLVFSVLAAGGWLLWDNYLKFQLPGNAPGHDQVIMYSLSDCVDCRARASELRAAGIFFTEILVDQDEYMLERMRQKLRDDGYRQRIFDFPVLDVHGTMLPGNPPMRQIREHLR